MQPHQPIMHWITRRQEAMLRQLIEWSNINTGSDNPRGIETLLAAVQTASFELGGAATLEPLPPVARIDDRGQTVERPLGPALRILKRPDAPRKIFLCIHSDTVYPKDSPFQSAELRPDGNLQGPGVADAKGGLIVMLNALAAFEQSPLAEKIGWEILINPDEEIGSPGSLDLLLAAAKRNQLGLLFETALSDGGIAERRKGAGNFSIVIHGRSAHTGRDFTSGRSAILAAAELTVALHDLNRTIPHVNVNVGSIDGGGPANVVPDLAICRVNVRTEEPQDESRLQTAIDQCIAKITQREGITAELNGRFHAAPKIPDAAGRDLLAAVVACGRELGLNISRRSVGGACDGNKLAAAGLPNVDTLGVRGGNSHSPQEFMVPASLTERAQLTALLLLNLASGDIHWPTI